MTPEQANGTAGLLLEMGMLQRAKRSGWSWEYEDIGTSQPPSPTSPVLTVMIRATH